jgi:hypothetical protein
VPCLLPRHSHRLLLQLPAPTVLRTPKPCRSTHPAHPRAPHHHHYLLRRRSSRRQSGWRGAGSGGAWPEDLDHRRFSIDQGSSHEGSLYRRLLGWFCCSNEKKDGGDAGWVD